MIAASKYEPAEKLHGRIIPGVEALASMLRPMGSGKKREKHQNQMAG
jgi:hypothetical protein